MVSTPGYSCGQVGLGQVAQEEQEEGAGHQVEVAEHGRHLGIGIATPHHLYLSMVVLLGVGQVVGSDGGVDGDQQQAVEAGEDPHHQRPLIIPRVDSALGLLHGLSSETRIIQIKVV